MTVGELYQKIGNYEEARMRLMSEKLIRKFIMKFPEDPSYRCLIKAWDARDEKEIFQCAHTMKGVCGNLALTKLYEISSEITESYRPEHAKEREEEQIAKLFSSLKTEYERVITQICLFSQEEAQ